MTRELRAVADECCRGRIVAVIEGGYDLHALAGSLDAVIETLNGPPSPAAWPSGAVASTRGRDSVKAASVALAPFWTIASVLRSPSHRPPDRAPVSSASLSAGAEPSRKLSGTSIEAQW